MRPAARSLVRGVTSLLVIIVGVLIALAADATWAERGDRSRERELLLDLLVEFRENEQVLIRDLDTNREAMSTADSWATAILRDSGTPPDSLAALFFKAWWGARFDPVTGVLRSVLESGELGLVRNADLRAALAGWLDRAEETRLTDRERRNMRASLAPLLLGLESGRAPSPAELSALYFDRALADGNIQLIPLLADLRDLIALLETELERLGVAF